MLSVPQFSHLLVGRKKSFLEGTFGEIEAGVLQCTKQFLGPGNIRVNINTALMLYDRTDTDKYSGAALSPVRWQSYLH